MKGRVLIVDDDARMGALLVEGLAQSAFEATHAKSADEALALLEKEDFAAVVTDVRMPGMKGTDFCARCALNRPDTPVIVMTAFGSLDTAVEAIRAGAYDFLTKPLQVKTLALALERATERRALREEVKRLRKAVAESQRFDELIGSSEPMRKIYELLDRVAETDTTVLITGETGTGKEVVARAVHARSRRKGAPFVAINCGAIPEALLESELFGHVKGAFTDARAARPGLFAQAKGGTVFLDEIGEMPREMQVKLLRALQERRARPVGGDAEVEIDVRVVAATNKELEKAVAEGNFREDLFYRLNVIGIELPPLRARGNDVLLLAQHFLEVFAARLGKKVTGIASGAAEKILRYAWPGNVREVQNCMERAVALTRFEQITPDDLPEKVRSYEKSAQLIVASDNPADLVPMDEIERRYVLRVYESVGGNKSLAAQILGFDRKTLYRKLERYGVATTKEE